VGDQILVVGALWPLLLAPVIIVSAPLTCKLGLPILALFSNRRDVVSPVRRIVYRKCILASRGGWDSLVPSFPSDTDIPTSSSILAVPTISTLQ